METSKTTTEAAPPSPWLTVKECAAYLRMSHETIRNMVRAGQLTAYRPRERGTILLSRKQIDGMVEAGRQEATA